MQDHNLSSLVAVIGAGPAGLMAAEVIARAGHEVAVFDAMPSAGRKLLRAGIGGLNITHAEPLANFAKRYGERNGAIAPILEMLKPAQLTEWVHELGIETFVGSSQRVFPVDKKAAPLLRAWLKRLRGMGVQFHMRSRWLGWEGEALRFETAQGSILLRPEATVLAMGGASWPELGSDARWVPCLRDRGVSIVPFRPSNCGFQVNWSEHFKSRYVRQPIKSVRARLGTSVAGADGWKSGELMVTEEGLEGGLVYALSATAREQVAQHGGTTLWLDLNPGRSEAQLATRLAEPRGKNSMAKHLKGKAGLEGVKASLLREFGGTSTMSDPTQLARLIKAVPINLGAPFSIDRAISSAGGVCFEELDEHLMLKAVPGVFCAGEMLDWEAPTGGYLITACMASGKFAGSGVLEFLAARQARLRGGIDL